MMVSKKWFFITFCLFLSVSVGFSEEPKKYLYFLGGGGEASGDSTIFDNDLKVAGRFVQSSNWKTTVSFNGGHKKTEEIIKKQWSKAQNAGAFVEKSYDALLNEMIKKIESGQIKAQDQLLVNIDTHGARARISEKEKTHSIALSGNSATNLSSLEGASIASLDRLEKLIDVATKNGVKLAIVDMSCFSGNTLKLKNDKVCLISASGPEHYGYAGSVGLGPFKISSAFSGKFYDMMKKGRNLEEIFLVARMRGDAPDFPMISTSEGAAVDELLYKLMTPYLRYNKSSITDLDESYSPNYMRFERQVCALNQNFNLLQEILTQYNSIKNVLDLPAESEFERLKKALAEYRDYQKQYEEALRGLLEAGLEVQKILERDYPEDKRYWESYEPSTFIGLELGSTIERTQDLINEAHDNWMKEFWTGAIVEYKKQQQIVNEVKAKLSPESKKKIESQEKFFRESGKSYTYASRVSSEAKKVYDFLYRSFLEKSGDNPCRDFVL